MGANATVVCGIELGRYCFIGAGAVVVRNVPDYALMVGNPARKVGWMSRHGQRLTRRDAEGRQVCPESGLRYEETADGRLHCVDLDEEATLAAGSRTSTRRYDEFKTLAEKEEVLQ